MTALAAVPSWRAIEFKRRGFVPGFFPCASGGNDGSPAGDPGGKVKTRQCQWVSTTNSANRDQRKQGAFGGSD
jgi:hypothetical protein